MNCRGFRKSLWETNGRTEVRKEAAEHARQCARCGILLERRLVLDAGLREMAARQAGWVAPARLQDRLLAAFRAQSPSAQRLPHPGIFTPAVGGILAAGALAAAIAIFLVAHWPPGSRAVPSPLSTAVARMEDSSVLDGGFVPLPYFGNAEAVSAQASDADVVRVEMPRSTLVALGVPLADDGAGGGVIAELLLGAGGMPQAVRVLE